MNRPNPSDTGTADRRVTRRRTTQGTVRLWVESPELVGHADNVSQTGVLFFSEGPLRVTVEIEENGLRRKRAGRLVRAQRMRGDNIGWAVEFDPTRAGLTFDFGWSRRRADRAPRWITSTSEVLGSTRRAAWAPRARVSTVSR